MTLNNFKYSFLTLIAFIFSLNLLTANDLGTITTLGPSVLAVDRPAPRVGGEDIIPLPQAKPLPDGERIPPPPVPKAPPVAQPPVVAAPLPTAVESVRGKKGQGQAGSESIPPPPVPPHTYPKPDHKTAVPETTREYAGPPQGLSEQQKIDQKKSIEQLAERVADLFACVPAHRDTQYTTQSWYLTDTFMAWNNAVAESVVQGQDANTVAGAFKAAALEKLKSRNATVASDPEAIAYIESASLAAEGIFKTAATKKEKVDFAGATKLMQSTSRKGGKNVFQTLKKAHEKNVALLSPNACAPIAKSFWSSPKFGVPSTEASRAVAANPSSAKAPGLGVRKVSEMPPSLVKDIYQKSQFDLKMEQEYPRAETVTAQLPARSFEQRNQDGYYFVGQHSYARPHIIANIRKAGERLKQEGMAMAVADLNGPGSADSKRAKTQGYRNRTQGKEASFMIMSPQGVGSDGDPVPGAGYDRDKTFRMIQTLIDADPENVKKIEVNDPELRDQVKAYLKSAYGHRPLLMVGKNSQFNNVVNFEWKK